MSAEDRPQEVADIVDELGDTPTANEIYQATDHYDTDYIAAAAYAAAKGGGGGGGSQPVLASYYGEDTAVPDDGNAAYLTVDHLNSGTDLLDRSDLAHPVFLAAGCYALSVVIGQDSTDGFFQAAIGTNPVKARKATAVQSLTLTATAAQGDPLDIFLQSFDGNAATAYISALTLVKFS